MSKALEKLEIKRNVLLAKLAEIDSEIRAERKKQVEAARRESLAILQKSGALDDPARLRLLLEKATAGDSRNKAKPTPENHVLDLPAPTGAGL